MGKECGEQAKKIARADPRVFPWFPETGQITSG